MAGVGSRCATKSLSGSSCLAEGAIWVLNRKKINSNKFINRRKHTKNHLLKKNPKNLYNSKKESKIIRTKENNRNSDPNIKVNKNYNKTTENKQQKKENMKLHIKKLKKTNKDNRKNEIEMSIKKEDLNKKYKYNFVYDLDKKDHYYPWNAKKKFGKEFKSKNLTKGSLDSYDPRNYYKYRFMKNYSYQNDMKRKINEKERAKYSQKLMDRKKAKQKYYQPRTKKRYCDYEAVRHKIDGVLCCKKTAKQPQGKLRKSQQKKFQNLKISSN